MTNQVDQSMALLFLNLLILCLLNMLAWLKADEMKALYLQPDVPPLIQTAHHKIKYMLI